MNIRLWPRTIGAMILAAITFLASFQHPAQAGESAMPLNSGWQLQDAARVPETGTAISSSSYHPQKWYPATVPGTVLTSLVNDGVYPEPLYGENNRHIPESLCRTSYWYRTTFPVPASFENHQVWLRFDGINYKAEVWVNGRDAGPIAGAFVRGIFDITPEAHVGTANTLAVEIFPLPHPGVPHEHTVANGIGGNGGTTAEDGPNFLCTVGWDWIPGIRDRDMGIWQGVTLYTTGPVTIADPYVTSVLPLPRTDSADLTLDTTLHNTSAGVQRGVLVGDFGPASGSPTAEFQYPVTLQPGETRGITLTSATTPALDVTAPKLWWPNGYGPQNLYALHLKFAQSSVESDAQDLSFGIRQITYALPGSDNLALSVNGVPVVAKGGDWGMDEAMKREPRSRLEAQIRMHRDANFTIIRNWVGQSTSEDFYELCDKYGILVWDEFFQPNPGDGPNPDDVALYMANVREKILRFRAHPCIALWCGRNEGFPPPAIDAAIRQTMTELERGRLYQPSSTSGRGVHSSGPYHYRVPAEFYKFNEPFKTEIGSISVPTLEAVRAMMPERDWNSVNDDWAEHDMARGAQDGGNYPLVLAHRFGTVVSMEDFVRKAQLANYEAFRAMFEGRFAKLFNPVTGVITWMSNPAQPSFVWQLYSHDLEPNASLFAVREACEPVHILLNQSTWDVMVVNNTPATISGLTALTTIYNLDGTLQGTHTQPVTAAPSAVTDLGPVAWPANLSPVHFVREQLKNAGGEVISDNFYWRANPVHPDDFTALQQMPAVQVIVSATRADRDGTCRVTATIHNPSNSVALMTHLQLRRAKTGERVLPVYYSDNYLSLLGGESRTITIEASIQDAGSGPLLLAVDGWNVSAAPVAAGTSTVGVVTNPDALQVHAWSVPDEHHIHAGGGQIGSFSADLDFTGGNATVSTDAVTTDGVAHAGPAALYDTERWGSFTYTLPAPPLPDGRFYTVRLHFSETRFDKPGLRQFNVAINGKPVLTNFDIFAEAGGKDRALVEEFPGVAPNPNGQIEIAFKRGSADEAKVCGVEIVDPGDANP